MSPLVRSIAPTRVALAALAVAVGLASSARADDPAKRAYNRDVRPILAENCFSCHGPDSAARKASLRLDKREAAIEAGAIEPGDPSLSEIIERVNSTDPDKVMPPPKSKKGLTADQKSTLAAWVKEGAEYQPHWSFLAPVRPELPAVKQSDWVKNPIDRFVLANLEARGLTPAPEADRRTLARRVSLDLTGLPPEPSDVDAFVNDASPDAYEKLVDNYLASPRWGEHRGRYWLDAARYADSHGIHFDNYREMWSYRDWVINALNKNVPFDQFTVEQIAGDLLPNRTLEQQIASGFNRCNMTTNEGGAINEEYLVLYARDRTETVSQVFMGLTTGCAVCHDHKFDPVSQKEFYQLSAFFNNTTQGAMDGNIQDTPPAVFVAPPTDRPRWEALLGEVAGLQQGLESRKQAARPEFDKWLAAATPETLSAMAPADGLKLRALLGDGDAPATGTKGQPSGVLELADAGDFEKDQAFSFGAFVRVPKPGVVGSVVSRMDDGKDYQGWDLWLENGRVGSHIVSKWPTDALKVVTNDEVLKPGELAHLFVTYDGSARPEGLKIYVNGQLKASNAPTNALKSSIKTTVPLKVAQRSNSAKLEDTAIRDLRLYGRALGEDEVSKLSASGLALYLTSKPADKRPGPDVERLFAWQFGTMDPEAAALRTKLAAAEKEQAEIKARGTVAHVMQEKTDPAMAYILNRGEYDKRGDQVKAATPAVLPALPDDLPRNRLGLAQWLMRPEHPLTARVTINRFWQELFGTGIVRTTGDFGVSGEQPSNQQLLDWMAVEFREGGWDMKKFMKLLVTSATYRQSAQTTPEKLEKDPANIALSRGPRFRMDAEMVRDYALATSGLLVDRIGGPSVKPYQPDGVWEAVAMIGSNTRDYKRDTGDKLYRRSLYTFWKRAAPPASMDIFNAPSREVCTVRRERTNTPLQALVTLNDPQFVEAAKVLAQRAIKEGGEGDDAKISFLSHRLIARPVRPEEKAVILASLKDLSDFYKANVEDAKKLIEVGETKTDPALDPSTLAAWTMLCNELMNLDEALNK